MVCSHVQWYLFYNLSYDDTMQQYGLGRYLQNYAVDKSRGCDLRLHMQEFGHFYVDVPFEEGDVRIFCCPEDRECTEGCLRNKRLCRECRVPLCRTCSLHAQDPHPTLSPVSLSNDLMVFYGPREFYSDGGLPVLEMICASTCITSMICFLLEVKYGNMFNSTAMMHRHRVGARGNATLFPVAMGGVVRRATESRS